MTTQTDDFEATRTIVTALTPFEPKDQERIIRWAREKVGLAPAGSDTGLPERKTDADEKKQTDDRTPPGGAKNIKSFMDDKKPATDIQFAAAVAYYYRFEAPVSEKKDAITSEDLQDACRKTGHDRFKVPSVTLNNAHNGGLLDKADRGTFRINTVGENLVAMTLPGGGSPARAPAKKPSARRAKKAPRTKKR